MTSPPAGWLWASQRTAPLPLILAGPIVRRVDPQSASVWVATRSATAVRLDVFAQGAQVATGSTNTVKLGDNLHVTVVTARPTSGAYQPGVLYTYQLTFGATTFATAMGGQAALNDICYQVGATATLPSFVLPPQALNGVRIVHASCRRTHADNLDALPILDAQLLDARNKGNDAAFIANRPQQLFLTGDQIYADDLCDAWLAMVVDMAGWLMGSRKEPPPPLIGPRRDGASTDFAWPGGFIWPGQTGMTPAPSKRPWAWPNEAGTPWPSGNSWPGVSFRGPIIQAAGFTSDPPEKYGNPPPDLTIDDDTFKMTAKNHLLLLGEFYATFLLSWSPVLWCFPQGGVLPFTPPSPWDEEAEAVAEFGAGLKAVRRALANIATYMICDDHEVTDDWYLNRLWCNRVLGQDADTLGRRVIRNALIAYAIFEAWGNEPDRYDAASPNGTSGSSLLSQLNLGTEMTIPSNGHGQVADLVGMPPPLGPNDFRLRRPVNALTWRWRWSPAGWPYEVIALDCRTARKYPAGLLDAPQLLDDGQRPQSATDTAIAVDEFALQLGPKQPGDVLSLVIAQTPVFGLREMERFQETRRLKKVFDWDAEAWGLNQSGFQLMISRLAQRNPVTVLLSGDVHFSFVSVCDYWASLPFGEQQTLSPPRASRIVQLNSSALKNEATKQQVLHRSGPTALHVGPNKNPQYWVGFTTGGRVRPAGAIPLGWQPWADYSPAMLNTPPVVVERGDYYQLFVTAAGSATLPDGDWQYKVEFLSGARAGPSVFGPPTTKPTPFDSLPVGPSNVADIVAALKFTLRAWERYGFGRTIIGMNNLATVTFSGSSATDRHVQQQVAWRPDDRSGYVVPLPTTTFDVAMQVGTAPQSPGHS